MPSQNTDTARGFFFALSAYLMWGVLPLYMKALAHIPPTEVIAHRVVWSVPIAGTVLLLMRRVGDIPRVLRSPRSLGMGVVTAALISVNWGVYVWSIANGQAIEAALGYYINPLFSIFLGAVLLGERPTRLQVAAIALAAAAVLVLTLDAGRLPVVALTLTISWGFYAYFKKSLPIGPNQGFLLEVLLLSPAALGYMGWLAMTGRAHFLAGEPADTWLLLGCGIVAAFDHRHHAIHRADDDLSDRGVRVRRAVRAGQDDRLSDDLGGPGDLLGPDAAEAAARQGQRGGMSPPGASVLAAGGSGWPMPGAFAASAFRGSAPDPGVFGTRKKQQVRPEWCFQSRPV